MFGVGFDKIILTIVGSIMVLVPILILVFIMYHRKNDEKAIEPNDENLPADNLAEEKNTEK